MSVFKEATRKGIRFSTSKGLVTTEDLWSFTLPQLDALAQTLDKAKEDSGKSFIKKASTASTEAKLKFDVVLEVINDKLEREEKRKKAEDNRIRRERILEAIAEQEDKALSQKSVDDLKKELQLLDEEVVA